MARQRKHGKMGQQNNHNHEAIEGPAPRRHIGAIEYEDRFSVHLKHQHQQSLRNRRRATLTQKFMTVAVIACTGAALTLICLLTYNGYLQTRVNTPFDKNKVGLKINQLPCIILLHSLYVCPFL